MFHYHIAVFRKGFKIKFEPEEKAWINENHTVRVRIGEAPPFMLTDGKVQGIAIDYLSCQLSPQSRGTWRIMRLF